jgi:sugar phosphate isomerase/epimerase
MDGLTMIRSMLGHAIHRRDALRAATAGLVGAIASSRSDASPPRTGDPDRLGLYIPVGSDPDSAIARAAALSLRWIEAHVDDLSDPAADALKTAVARHGARLAAVFAMGPGPQAWDFRDGPATGGLVPREHRTARVVRLKRASDFARRAGAPAIETHVGFIPENPRDPLYRETVEALCDVVRHCSRNDQTFLYHAGQETPVTLLRTIRDVGLPNQGIGLDTANGVMYGTGHPADALAVYGSHVRLVNAKDGLWPTDPDHLGREVPLGKGDVDMPRVLTALSRLGYQGPILIERETTGPEQVEDVRRAALFLRDLMKT